MSKCSCQDRLPTLLITMDSEKCYVDVVSDFRLHLFCSVAPVAGARAWMPLQHWVGNGWVSARLRSYIKQLDPAHL